VCHPNVFVEIWDLPPKGPLLHGICGRHDEVVDCGVVGGEEMRFVCHHELLAGVECYCYWEGRYIVPGLNCNAIGSIVWVGMEGES